jgi:hypothetical protein
MKRLIEIPFDGFYESYITSCIDNEEEYLLESVQEDKNEALQATFDWDLEALTKDYSEYFMEWLRETTGIDMNATFGSLEHPKEYNFSTDRVFMSVDEDKALELKGWIEVNCKNELQQCIEKVTTSVSGYFALSTYEEVKHNAFTNDEQACSCLPYLNALIVSEYEDRYESMPRMLIDKMEFSTYLNYDYEMYDKNIIDDTV